MGISARDIEDARSIYALLIMESPPGREDTTKLRDVHGRELDLARRIDLSSPIGRCVCIES